MGFGFVMFLPTDVGVLFELVYSRIDKSNEIMLMSLIRKMVSNISCKYHYKKSQTEERRGSMRDWREDKLNVNSVSVGVSKKLMG